MENNGFKAYENEAMNRYFNSLPPVIQEMIFQSGVQPRSEGELRSIADSLTKPNQKSDS